MKATGIVRRVDDLGVSSFPEKSAEPDPAVRVPLTYNIDTNRQILLGDT